MKIQDGTIYPFGGLYRIEIHKIVFYFVGLNTRAYDGGQQSDRKTEIAKNKRKNRT